MEAPALSQNFRLVDSKLLNVRVVHPQALPRPSTDRSKAGAARLKAHKSLIDATPRHGGSHGGKPRSPPPSPEVRLDIRHAARGRKGELRRSRRAPRGSKTEASDRHGGRYLQRSVSRCVDEALAAHGLVRFGASDELDLHRGDRPLREARRPVADRADGGEL